MAILAWVFGILGGLCAATGIVTATEEITQLNELGAQFTTMFWLVLSAILLLACIAAAVSHKDYE